MYHLSAELDLLEITRKYYLTNEAMVLTGNKVWRTTKFVRNLEYKRCEVITNKHLNSTSYNCKYVFHCVSLIVQSKLKQPFLT
jgi:hypothetical protein